MKKASVFLSMLAVALLVSAAPAFSATGPYGSFGFSDNVGMWQGGETQQSVAWGATGPYGVFGPTYKGDNTPRTSIAGGSGPYGAFTTFGMIGGVASDQIGLKDECLLVAKLCPSDLNK